MTNRRLKVIHIHTDLKFIKATSRFEGNYFENLSFVILKERQHSKFEDNNEIKYFKDNKRNLKKIISLCSDAEVVVLYNLCGRKSFISNRLPENTQIIWRFFGQELYSKLWKELISEETLLLLSENKLRLFYTTKKKTNRIISFLKNRINFSGEFQSALKKINYFACLSEEEYCYLKHYWPNLPAFLKLPVRKPEGEIKAYTPNEKQRIIIGNNKSRYNNHVDIVNIIKKANIVDKSYSFEMLFNYGNETKYSSIIRKLVKESKNIRLIEGFMHYDEFENYYEGTRAFVLNGYRQMALGNIFIAFEKGTKVYLNKKNPVYNWLKSEEFLIFTIEDFIKDLKTDNLLLEESLARHNLNCYKKIAQKYSENHFQEQLYLKILENNP